VQAHFVRLVECPDSLSRSLIWPSVFTIDFGGSLKAAYFHPTHFFNPNFYILLINFLNIMAKDSTRMPMSTAGITQYFDEYRSKIEFSPGHIIVFSVIVILIIVALHIWGSSLLGLV